MFADACYELAKSLNIKMSFKEQGANEEEYLANISKLAYAAYEDQCSTANPRLPLVEDMKEILEKAYFDKK
jgi:acetaldehyde dehydrogenase/alcohol dehydrogenase